MAIRWRMLALLFLVRMAMAAQFQSVGATAPVAMEVFGVGLAEIGLLIGLYFAPGVVVALPGGAIGRRLGERRAAMAGLALMALGGALMAGSDAWSAQLGGRLVAGAGGIVLNVVMTKMVADWFAGREMATAMAVFVTSWPVGVALALLALPPLAAAAGPGAAQAAVAGYALLALLALAALYRTPPGEGGAAPSGAWPSGAALRGVVAAGLVWGLYNAALAMTFSFGPAMLTERGWSVAPASAATSLVLWLFAVSVPFGGWLADRTGRRDRVLALSLGGFALAMVAATAPGAAVPAFLVLGLIGGLAAGPIMSLPAAALAPETRALGMGLFYTVYYACMLAAPPVAGRLGEAAGGTGAAFLFGAAMLAAALVGLAGYRRIMRG